jgi:hypothetical protein
LAEGGGYLIDGTGNLRESAVYGQGDGGVFGVDEAGNLEGGFAVEVARGLVRLLGA